MIIGSLSAGWIPSQTTLDPYIEIWDGRKGKEVPHHEQVLHHHIHSIFQKVTGA